jgi:hypothetical protein
MKNGYNMTNLIIILLCLGFFITLNNTFDQKMYYGLKWVSHPYGYPFPIGMAGGEMDAGEANTIDREFSSGVYKIMWWSASSEDDYETEIGFVTSTKTKAVLTTPREVSLK